MSDNFRYPSRWNRSFGTAFAAVIVAPDLAQPQSALVRSKLHCIIHYRLQTQGNNNRAGKHAETEHERKAQKPTPILAQPPACSLPICNRPDSSSLGSSFVSGTTTEALDASARHTKLSDHHHYFLCFSCSQSLLILRGYDPDAKLPYQRRLGRAFIWSGRTPRCPNHISLAGWTVQTHVQVEDTTCLIHAAFPQVTLCRCWCHVFSCTSLMSCATEATLFDTQYVR